MTESTKQPLDHHLPLWPELKAHQQNWQASLAELFQGDEQRAQTFSLSAGDLFLDYSKSHLTVKTRQLLTQLCEQAQLPAAIKAMFNGDVINNTEQRAAWHVALRAQEAGAVQPPEEVTQVKARMRAFTERVTQGQCQGFKGDTITDVVNIGIGGSDLGPRMVCKALADYHLDSIRVHFVANIDGAEIHQTLSALNPATTLFIIASKTFTTLETLQNAQTARNWVMEGGCSEDQLHRHFAAISTNIEKATAFGISEDNIFAMWDWVGGRYSLWSAIGLPIAVAIGWERFEQLLSGAAVMDNHFAEASFDNNMPVILALLTFWYSQCWGAQSQAILPYCHNLQLFPNFLQQLDMESLGKQVNRAGEAVDYPTGIAIWGTEESNGQHSFHQLFHQGTLTIPVDFIATLKPNHPLTTQHHHLLSCCLSQSQAMLSGKSLEQARRELTDAGYSDSDAEQLAAHKVIPGNRPSNTLLLEQLTPSALGQLIALYEHKVYVLSVLLNINAFDQWGVELGKQLGVKISDTLEQGKIDTQWDASTQLLASKILHSKSAD